MDFQRSDKPWFLALFIGACLLALAIASGVYWQIAADTTQRIESRLTSIARVKIDSLVDWLQERFSDMRVLAANPLVLDLFASPRARLEGDRRALQEYVEFLRKSYNYSCIELVTIDGERKLESGCNFDTTHVDRAFNRELVAQVRQPVLIDLFALDDADHPFDMAVAMPVIVSGAPVGILFGHIDPRQYLFPKIQSWPVPSESGETLLVRRDGDSVQFINRLRLSDAPPLSLRISLQRLDVPAVRAVTLGETVGEGVDYRGVKVLSKTLAVPGTTWFMVAKMDADEALGELRRIAIETVAVTLLLLFAVGRMLYVRYRAQQLSHEKNLLAQRVAFQSVFDQVRDPVLILDADDRIDYVNPAADTLLNGLPEPLTSVAWPSLLPDGDGGSYADLSAALFEGREELVERLIIARDGRKLFVEIRAWRMADGQISLNLRDVSAERRARKALIDQRDRLEQQVAERTAELSVAKDLAEAASRAKSAFLANMSHEIRTPMNAIIGFTYMLRRDNVTPGQAERLGRIASAAEHLLEIINDILDISKIEAGKMELECVDFELDNVIRQASSIIALRTQAKGLELVVDSAGLPRVLNGDPTRLSQMLINYLNNAVKFTEKGSIVLRVRQEAEAGDIVTLRFEVEDTGIGIAEAALPRLFSSFEQADSSTTRVYGGTGLGLAITRNLALLMDGEVGVSSILGKGSRFWFTARLRKVAGGAEESKVDGLRDLRALVADDLPITQMVHAQLLRQLGMRPLVVASGQEAITAIEAAAAEQDPIAVAFIDLQMPDLDGITAMGRIRQLPLGKAPLCVLVTAFADADVRANALAAGFQDVLLKPVSAKLLREWLVEHHKRGDVQQVDTSDDERLLRSHWSGSRILLAEDDLINQLVAEELLADVGMVVTIANDGEEACRLAAAEPFDLILLDMQMPVKDGIQAARDIRALPAGKDIPIVAMTGNAFAEDRARCFEAGMNDFVAKPVDPDLLFRVLLKWLSRKGR